MPFDQRRTTHVFHSTANGGVQRVIAKDASDSKQIGLVRQHLRKEAVRLGVGDFTDPMAIHGMKMPGLDALRRNGWRGLLNNRRGFRLGERNLRETAVGGGWNRFGTCCGRDCWPLSSRR